FFAGDEPRELNLPGGVIERLGSRARCRRYARDILRDLHVLAEREKAAICVVGLRRDADALAVGVCALNGAVRTAIAEERLLSWRAITRQERRRRAAGGIDIRAGNAEAESTQGVVIGRVER